MRGHQAPARTRRGCEARQPTAGRASEARGRAATNSFGNTKRPVLLSEDRAFSVTTTGAVGVEPTTARLTVECSAIELHPIRGRKRPRGPAPNIARYTRQLNSVVRINRDIVQNGTTCCLHAQTEGRTRKPFRVGDFESPASASSAIRAYINCAQTSVHGWRKRRHGGPLTSVAEFRVAEIHGCPWGRRWNRACPSADAANPACRGAVHPEARSSARAASARETSPDRAARFP